MSGIKEAFERVGNRLNTGYCVFRGAFDNIGSFISVSSIKFIIVELDHNLGFVTVFDYNGDVRISNDIVRGSRVELQIKDNYSAKWEEI
jgi:hypothetical protein